ncbi:MAG: UDP-N-acetylglucosamine 1-carboxyvinyltransferase [Clostridia bacterium]|nr:UDP-N-acetylglucosamine 1-carboxyvinyltransferase [Clostridia bacterium]
MARYRIPHTEELKGEVTVSTAKNAVLPILCCALLTPEEVTIRRVPHLTDVDTLGHILNQCGVLIQKSGDDWTLCAPSPQSPQGDEAMGRMRASVLVMGPLLARTGHAAIALPGGCAIGQRPIDLHLKGMQALGAQVEQHAGWVTLSGKLTGGSVYLDLPSVGATENILMAAVLAQGITRIENAAKEPEITDLAACLIAMGAKIRGAGTSTIWVEGVSRLHGVGYQPIADRIEAGTLICAAAMTRGSVLLRGSRPDHMRAVLFKLMESGVTFRETRGGLFIHGQAHAPLQIRTLAYPGFPTDLQAPLMVVSLTAPSPSVFLETIFENRYMHAQELRRMGARIHLVNRAAIVEGGSPLQGASVTSTDLRAGAALMLAGLWAQGETELNDPNGHIVRGYEDLPGKLNRLGAHIETVME